MLQIPKKEKVVSLPYGFDPASITFEAEFFATGIKVLVTYGGGMGGSAETVYFEQNKMESSGDSISGEDITGRSLEINKSFIAYIEDVNFVKIADNSSICYVVTPKDSKIKYVCNGKYDDVVVEE